MNWIKIACNSLAKDKLHSATNASLLASVDFFLCLLLRKVHNVQEAEEQRAIKWEGWPRVKWIQLAIFWSKWCNVDRLTANTHRHKIYFLWTYGIQIWKNSQRNDLSNRWLISTNLPKQLVWSYSEIFRKSQVNFSILDSNGGKIKQNTAGFKHTDIHHPLFSTLCALVEESYAKISNIFIFGAHWHPDQITYKQTVFSCGPSICFNQLVWVRQIGLIQTRFKWLVSKPSGIRNSWSVSVWTELGQRQFILKSLTSFVNETTNHIIFMWKYAADRRRISAKGDRLWEEANSRQWHCWLLNQPLCSTLCRRTSMAFTHQCKANVSVQLLVGSLYFALPEELTIKIHVYGRGTIFSIHRIFSCPTNGKWRVWDDQQ